MQVSRSFIREVGAAESSLFEVLGNVDGGLLVSIDNTDQNNPLLYRFQESYDGVTWVDKTFTTSGGDTASQFSIAPEAHHEIKVAYTRQRLRLMASGNLVAHIGLSYRQYSSLNGAFTINP